MAIEFVIKITNIKFLQLCNNNRYNICKNFCNKDCNNKDIFVDIIMKFAITFSVQFATIFTIIHSQFTIIIAKFHENIFQNLKSR